MIDSYLLLTPLILLPIVALLGFVGCNWFFGIEDTRLAEPGPGPTGFVASAGNNKVALSWDPYPGATEFRVKRGKISGAYDRAYAVIDVNLDGEIDTSFTDYEATNGNTFFYVVTAIAQNLESEPSEERDATPTAAALVSFVASTTPGSVVPSAAGWFGMAIKIGGADVSVQTLGRAFAPGNSQIHVIKIVDSSGQDLPNAFVPVNMAGGTLGEFRYAALPSPVVLNSGMTYYIVSQEIIGGDAFYNHDTTVQTTNAATLISAVRGGPPYVTDSVLNKPYGPVDFQY